MMLLGLMAFVGGEILAVVGVFTGLVAIYPSFAPDHLALSLLAVAAGTFLAALGGMLMPYASDRMHIPWAARERAPLAGFAASLHMIAAINGALLGPAGAVCAFIAFFIEGVDPYLVALLLVSALVGALSFSTLSAASDRMGSDIN